MSYPPGSPGTPYPVYYDPTLYPPGSSPETRGSPSQPPQISGYGTRPSVPVTGSNATGSAEVLKRIESLHRQQYGRNLRTHFSNPWNAEGIAQSAYVHFYKETTLADGSTQYDVSSDASAYKLHGNLSGQFWTRWSCNREGTVKCEGATKSPFRPDASRQQTSESPPQAENMSRQVSNTSSGRSVGSKGSRVSVMEGLNPYWH